MTSNTFDQIKQILVERFGIDAASVHLTTNLQQELNLDSVDAIDLLMAINETFAIRIPEQTLEKIHTVSELVDCVSKYRPRRK